MFKEFFDKPAIDEIRSIDPLNLRGEDDAHISATQAKRLKDARDIMRLCDIPGLIALAHEANLGYPRFLADLEKGDELAAAEIERLVSNIETRLLLTSQAAIADNVEGAFPNVPAYVQGNPYNMRTKKTRKSGRGPLSLYLETTTSVGFSDAEGIGRMAAMIALAKAMAQVRPLDFWFTATYGGGGQLLQTSVRMDTTPIDYARVAVLCGQVSIFNEIHRTLAHRDVRKMAGEAGQSWRAFGSWAYGVPNLERKWAGEILGRIVSPGSQICYLGAAFWHEYNPSNPEAWIMNMLRQYGGYLLDGEDRDDAA